MGVVYKAEDIRLKRIVALKFLSPEITRDQDAKNRFIHEAQAASALDHPRIGIIYEIDETEDGQMFIAMAYYDGETLRKKLESGPIGVEKAINIAIQVANGLAAAHEQGIVHRDIKPANIIITKEGFVKIVDFGLAKLAGATRITKNNITMGTPAYMSPEQVTGQEVNHQSDIWSLGVILYELLTKQLPFSAEYEIAMLYTIVNENPVPVSQLNTTVPVELERIINKTLEKQVENRYASMEELLADLNKCQLSLKSKDKTAETGINIKAIISPGKLSKISNLKTILTTALILILALLGIANFSNILNIIKPDYGYLNLTSNPQGAFILLNGEATKETTPKILGPLKTGTCEVALTLDGFENWSKNFTITKNDTLSDLAQLKPIKSNFSSLIVKSEPSGASIFLDSKETGKKTPTVLENIYAGKHKIQLKKDGYHYKTTKINIDLKEQPLSALLVRTFILENNKEKFRVAAVYIDGEYWGQSWETLPLKSGTYKRKAQLFGYTPLIDEQRISIQGGEVFPVKFVFVKERSLK